ncbi:MAG: nucleotidyl transferase AbiEii/AbiGii toxin family protein [Chromatiaceae bacterium]|nr:nucleotidyl transferase AbiEii/AbiGii toxin family protein [Chromatiaceae bacterium]
MDKIANLRANERRELFQETAARKGIHPAVVEKDFWVCWVLKHIFEDLGMRSHVIFKGGTSLSKVFGLIERFSEDIDLILDWSLLGYGPGQQDPFPDDLSNTKRDQFNKQFNEAAAAYIRETLCPQLGVLLKICPAVRLSIDVHEGQVVESTIRRPFPRLTCAPRCDWRSVPWHPGFPTTSTASDLMLPMPSPRSLPNPIVRSLRSGPSGPSGKRRPSCISRLIILGRFPVGIRATTTTYSASRRVLYVRWRWPTCRFSGMSSPSSSASTPATGRDTARPGRELSS